MQLADALGYARVSTAGQDLKVQRRRLRDEAKVVRVFDDVISGKSFLITHYPQPLLLFQIPANRHCRYGTDLLEATVAPSAGQE